MTLAALWMDSSSINRPVGNTDLRLSSPKRRLLPPARIMAPIILISFPKFNLAKDYGCIAFHTDIFPKLSP
jgi:hypothetical protein